MPVTLGAVIPNDENPVHAEAAERLARLCGEAGYGFALENAAEDAGTPAAASAHGGSLERLLSRGVSGVFALSVPVDKQWLYERVPVPTVLLGTRTESNALDYIVLDDYHAAFLVVSRLAACRHRRIAFLSFPGAQGYSALDRMNGFRKAVKRQGESQFDIRLSTLASERLADSCAAAAALLALPERPTAIVAQNDYIAYGALQAVSEAGLKLGRDVVVIGFDDLEYSSLPKISLSSVACEGPNLSTRGFSLMQRRLSEPCRVGRCGVLLAPRLVFRKSFTGETQC